MLLKKLKLVNFRQFYGDTTEIHFSTDVEKNITLIHGENGIGKTTILNSILWCLYYKTTKNFEQPDKLVCIQSEKEGNKSCQVEVSFEYKNRQYSALRSLQNSLPTPLKIWEITDGNYAPVSNPDSFINSILPKDMAEYFFFHGEGVSNINANTNNKQAIRAILGFNLAETAVLDLKDISKAWTKELSELNNLSQEQSDLIKKKMVCENKTGSLEVEISSLEADKEMYLNDLESVLNGLRNCTHVDAQELQKQIDILVRKNNDVNSKILEAKKQHQALIKKYGFIVFGQKLANEALDFIDEQSLKAKLPAPYDESLVKDLIEQEHCICGRELKAGSAEYLKVINLIEKADNAGIRNKLMKARSAGGNIRNRLPDFLVELKNIKTRILELDRDKSDLESSLTEKNKALKEIDIDKVKKLENKKDACNSRLGICNQDIGSKKRNFDILKNDLQGIELKLKRFGAQDIHINRLTGHQKYVEELINRCETKLKKHEEDSKLTIASKVNRTLQDFSRQDFHVKVDRDFSFSLIRKNGESVARGNGEKLLLNLSFISSLIEFAKMRSGASGEFLVSGTTAPFVIDAPFGELDNAYKRATAKFLPEKSRQIIFLLSSSHWSGVVDEEIKNKVGSEYILLSSKTIMQDGKPDDKLLIDGKEYIQSLYNQDKDATFIERVR